MGLVEEFGYEVRLSVAIELFTSHRRRTPSRDLKFELHF